MFYQSNLAFFIKSFVLLSKFTEDKSLSQNSVDFFRLYTFHIFIFILYFVSPWLGPSPGWGPVRVGAQSGLGPGPGWGPYGPIWALMLVFKSEAFRVQTAPFDKIRIEFRRSRRRLLIPDLLKAKKLRRQIIIF